MKIRRFTKARIFAVAIGTTALSPVIAHADFAYDTVIASPTALNTACNSDITCAALGNIRIASDDSGVATGWYAWVASCSGSIDGLQYIRPTGAVSGCFTQQGLAIVTTANIVATISTPASGDMIYRNSSSQWQDLTASGVSNGSVIVLSGGVPTWGAVPGASGCAVIGGTVYQPLINNGSGGCTSNANSTLNGGAFSLGGNSVSGYISLGNAVSGIVTIQPVSGAFGSVAASLPGNNGTLTESNYAQSWNALQTFVSGIAVSGLTVSGNFTAPSLVTNADLANTSVTFNGTTVALGASGTITATAATITVGTTTISGGTSHGLLYDNAGTLGNTTSGNSGVLVTNASGVPSISTTLPSSLSIPSPTITTAFSAVGLVTLADLTTQATNTVLANVTSGTASPTALAVSSCSAAADALIWTTNTGFGCNTSITAASAPASALTGTTLASGIVTSSLTSVGTLATGTWQASVVSGTYGGTGINNGSSTITLGASLTTTGSGTPTLAFGGTGYTYTFPAGSGTLGSLALADQALGGGVWPTAVSHASGAVTVDCGAGPQQYIANNGAFTITAPAHDSNCLLLIRNGGSAGAVTFSGFTTVSGQTGTAIGTTSGSVYTVMIWRITDATGSVAGYTVTQDN